MKPEKKIFYIGQQLRLIEYPSGHRGDAVVRNMKVLKLYRRFALCRVNASYNECFTYEELGAAVEV